MDADLVMSHRDVETPAAASPKHRDRLAQHGRLREQEPPARLLFAYFVGVHFLRKRRSSLLNGVGEDAAIVARQIAARQAQSAA